MSRIIPTEEMKKWKEEVLQELRGSEEEEEESTDSDAINPDAKVKKYFAFGNVQHFQVI